MVTRVLATAGLLLVLLAATASCTGGTPDEPSAAPVVPSSSPAVSAAASQAPGASPSRGPSPRPSPSLSPTPVGDPAPPELIGEWHTAVTNGEQVTLRLQETLYGITRGAGVGSGKLVVQGGEITFFGSQLCEGTGTYRWSLADGALTFTPVGPDACGGRSLVLDGFTYTGGPDPSP